MNKDEILRRSQGKKTYHSPTLNLYGTVSQLSAGGTGTDLEGRKREANKKP
ncbi:MAG: hypothetical protein H8E35_08530 [Ardenticatenia bacterium]|nr:hypothetical protein [Ardenticatenia bacterium]